MSGVSALRARANARIVFAFLAVSCALSSERAEAVTCSAIGGGSWTTAATWNCGAGPSTYPGQNTGDTAILNASGVITVSSAVPNAVTVTQSCGSCTLSVNGGSITLAGTSIINGGALAISSGSVNVNTPNTLTIDAPATFQMTGGSFNGTGDLTVNVPMSFNGGTIQGSGATIFNAAVTADPTAGYIYFYANRNVTSNASFTYRDSNASGRYLGIYNGATFNNNGTFDIQIDRVLYGGDGTFYNNATGTVTKSAGAGVANIEQVFYSSGSVSVASGTLQFSSSGSSSGSWTAATGTALRFSGGTRTMDASASFSGAGTFEVTGGTTNFAGTYNASATNVSGGTFNLNVAGSTTTFTQTNGTMGGNGTLTVSGAANLLGGTMQGPGTTIFNGATIADPSSGYIYIYFNRTITSNSSFTYRDTAAANRYLYIYSGSTFNNNGTFDVQIDRRIVGSDGTFNNSATGSVTKSAGTGVAEFEQAFNNNGTVSVASGTLEFSGAGTSNGSWTVPSGTAVRFSGGTRTVNAAASVTGTGTFEHTAGTTNFAGTFNVSGTSISNGTFNLNSAGTTTTYTQTGGVLGGSGTLTISGAANLNGGTMQGPGTTVFNGATVADPSSGYLYFYSNRIVTSNSTFTYRDTTAGGRYLHIYTGSTFNNNGAFDVQIDRRIVGSDGTFNNNATGTVTKSAGAGVAEFEQAFNNNGAVSVSSGTLEFSGAGTSNGSWTVASGTTLRFSGGARTLNASSTITGTGTFSHTGGTSTIAGTLNITSTSVSGGTFRLNNAGSTTTYAQTGGTLEGTATLTVSGTANLNGGTMQGVGATVFNGPVFADPTTSYIYFIGNRVVTSNATFTYRDTAAAGRYLSIYNGATFNNNGTFDIQIDRVVNGGDGTFNNNAGGTVTKSAGSGIAKIDQVFNNDGTVSAASGTLEFEGSGVSNGSWSIPSGSALRFSGGTHTVNASSSVTGAGTFEHTGGTTNFAGTLNVTALNISGGTLNVNAAGTTTTYAQSAGTLAGTGTLTVSGAANVNGGTMRGAGTTIFNGAAIADPTANYIYFINGRIVTSNGTFTYRDTTASNRYLHIYGGATFNNNGTFDIQIDRILYGGDGTFNNNATGTLTKSAGSGVSVVDQIVNNNGAVSVGSGTLEFTGAGTSAGTWSAASGTTLRFSGATRTITPAGSINAAGTVAITGGTLTLNGSASVATLVMSNGTLNGAGNFAITGTATWSGGTMSGSGTTTISAGATASITPTVGYPTLDTRTINNAGTVIYSGTPYYLQLANGATFNNSALFEIQSNQTINAYGTASTFENLASGTLQKTAGGAVTNFEPRLDNDGAVLVSSGELSFAGGGTSNGSWTTSAGATTSFRCCGMQSIAGGSMTGAGSIDYDGGTVNITGGTYNMTSTGVHGGTVNFEVAASIGSLSMSSGFLGGAGVVTVSNGGALTGGTIRGTGTLDLSGGIVGISPTSGYISIETRTINNNGATVTYSGTPYYLQFGNAATFNNNAMFDIQSNQIINAYGTLSTFNNGASGTLQKTAGGGITTFEPSVNNNGSIAVGSGELSFGGGGTSNGSWNAGSGTTISFRCCGTQTVAAGTMTGLGSFDFDSGTVNIGSSYSPAGTTVAGGTVNFNSTASTGTLTMTGGTLGGSGTFTVSNGGTMSGGTMNGTGATTLSAGTFAITATSGYPTFDTRTLNNNGTIVYTGSPYYLQFANGCTINNSGVFDIQSNQYINAYGTPPVFKVNAGGTLQKSAGGGTTNFEPRVDNDGTVIVSNGELSFAGGGTSAGTWNTLAGTTLSFRCCGTQNVTGSIGGPGTLASTGGTLNVNGTYNATGALNVAGGTINLNVPGSTTAFTLSSGTLGGSGTLTVDTTGTLSGGTMNGTGPTNFAAGSTTIINATTGYVTIDGRTITNSGAMTYNGSPYYLQLANGAAFNNNATFELANNQTIYAYGSTPVFTNGAAGIFQKTTPTGSTSFNPSFVNNGSVLANSGTISFGGGFTQTAGSTVVNGTISSPSTLVFNGGTLSGSGTISANVSNAAQVNAGSSPGILTISGNYSQGPTGVINAELNGTTPGTGYDQINISGSAALNGTLNITTIGGFTPPNGSTYQILNFASRSGDFATKSGLVYAGGSYTYLLNPTNIQLTAGACAPPDATVTAPASVCPNASGGASVPVTTGATYAWTVTNGTIATGQGTNAIAFNAGTVSPVTVTVTVTVGGCSNTGTATIAVGGCAPTLTAVRPNGGATTGGNMVVLDGMYLSGVTSVLFGATPGTLNYLSATELTVTAPAGAGTVGITVSDGTSSSTLPGAFVYSSDDDLARDFSLTNPSPRWTYGWSPTRGGAFTAFGNGEHAANGMDYWNIAPGGLPNLSKNRTTSTITQATNSTPAGKVVVHPGSSGENPVVRWTAPSTNTFRILGSFVGYDSSYPTTTDVAILKNNSTASTLFSGNINSYNAPLPFDVTVAMNAGETIEFTVGYGNGSFAGDATGVDATISVTAPVCTPPTPSVTPSGPTTFCAGGSVTLSTSGSGSFQWFLDGVPINAATGTSLVASSSGSYTVTETTAPSCSGTSSPVVVTVTPGPDTTITAPSSVPANSGGHNATVTAGSSSAGYSWSVTGGTITSATNVASITFTAGASGNMTLSATVTDNGCTATGTTTVTIVPCTPPNSTITAPSSVAANSSGHTASVAPPSANATYSWSISGGTFTSATNGPSVTFDAGASGSVSLTVSVTDNGCTGTSSTNVTITPCVPPNSAITAPASVQANSTGNNASVTPAGPSATYAWTISGGTITSATNSPSITFTAGAAGSVNLTVAVTENACTGTGSTSVAIVSCTAPNTSITAPSSVVANSTGNDASVPTAGVNATYAWSISGGTITSVATAPAITFSAGASGNVVLSVVVTDNGCSASGATTIAITGCTPPNTTISAPSSVNANSSGHTASVPAASPGATYSWSISGGTITSAVDTPSIAFTAGVSGSVTLSVVVTDNACTATGTTTVAINACTPPNATITAPASVVASSSGNNASVATAGPNATYAWSISGGTITSATNTPFVTFSAGASGSVNLSVTVTDNGCAATGTATVAITACTPPDATISAPAEVAANSTGNTASVPVAGANATYAWTMTGGAIASGASTNSIVFSASGSGTVTLGVTVTDSGCSSSSTQSIAIAASDLSIDLAGPSSIGAGSSFAYTAFVANAGPSTAQLLQLIVNLPANVVLGPTNGPWTCSNASNVLTCTLASLSSGASETLIVNVTAPSAAGSLSASAQVSATTVDTNGSNNAATVATTVTGGTCATVVPLTAPAAGAANLTNPVTFSWSAVSGATEYELFVGAGSATPSSAAITSATFASVSRPAGTGSWYVVARFGGTNCTPAISETRTFSVAVATQCANGAPEPVAPANGAIVPSPVTFTWIGVPNAISYTVFASIDGAPSQDIGSTGATSLAVSLNAASVVWVVQANFAGCPATQSNALSFKLQQPGDCENNGKATLVGPAGTTTAPVTFRWNSVDGADEYRVWASVDGKGFESMGTTIGTSLSAPAITKGAVEWFVESLFDGCASTESAHLTFTIPTAQDCNNAPATLVIPANGVTVNNQTIEFTWTPAQNAIGYEVYISLANGTPTLLGTTTNAVTLRRDVAPGNLEWFVRALFSGCDPVDSQHFTFSFDPPPACPTGRPLLLTPGEGALTVTSPVTFDWTGVQGATQYRLSYSVDQGAVTTLTTTQTSLPNVVIANGAVSWSVEAITANCPSLISTASTFTVVPPPPACSTPATTDIRATANTSSGNDYDVQWDPIPGAVSYELQESISADFSAVSLTNVTGTSHTFRHSNDSSATTALFYYRVRGVNNCNSTRGLFSEAVVVGILPLRQLETNHSVGATQVSNPQPTIYELQICTTAAAGCTFVAAAGQTFTATTDKPWLTVSPATGTVPANGIILTVTAATTNLGVGTNTGAVHVVFAGGSTVTGGKVSHDGPTTATTNISVNLVSPVAPTPNNTPPPDALIIPAVAHATGLNSKFESDIRVTNTSAQPMKYQLTFTPTGEAGIAEGKQATIDIEPGRTVALDDVLNSWFGAGTTAAGATGALEIRPLTRSATSVSSSAVSGLPNISTFATSRTFSVAGAGSFGTVVPAIPYANFIGQTKDATKPSVISLQQVAQTNSLRTNFGLKEGSGQPATVLVSLFNSSGGKVGEFEQKLNGGQHIQINSVFARQNLTNIADGRIEVRVTSATGKVTAYASVLDGNTNDAQLVSPVALSQAGAARYVLPGVADRSDEAGKVQTDVRLFNASGNTVTAILSMYAAGSTTPQTKEVTLAASEVKTLDVGTFFGAANAGNAALHISTSTPSNLIATARSYTQTAAGTLGQFINAVTPAGAITTGSRPLQLLQVEESNRFSTEVGIAEVTGKPVELEISVIPQDSKVAAKVNVSLKANEYQSMPQLLKSMGLDGSYNARVTVKVLSGAGAATAYAAVTDKVTKDPTYVPAQ